MQLSDAQVELVERMATFGLTQAQIADCLPMAERTLRERIRDGEHPDIAAAYARGRARDARTLSERHRDIALGKMEDVSASEQRKAIQWRLERQHGWSETMLHEHAGPGGGNIPTEVRVQLVSADAGHG